MNKYRFSTLLFAIVLLAGCAGPAYRSRVIETPETSNLKGWEKPYEVNGKRYNPLRPQDQTGYVEDGVCSWYGPDFHGKATSNGETYNMYAMTAAHKTLPLGCYVRVHNKANGRETVVRINDRGPFVKGRIIDLSYAAAKDLGVVGPGTAPVRIEALGFRSGRVDGHDTYRQPKSYDVGPFAIQVGAFTVAVNAQRLAARMQSRYGYAEVQKGWVGGRLFYRVRVGKYPTVEAAEGAKGSFERGGYPSCFVVAIDPN